MDIETYVSICNIYYIMLTSPISWLVLTSSFSGRAASTPRVRLWRALKELGASLLRDGVALLPATDTHRARFQALCEQIEAEGGTAWLFELQAQQPHTEKQLRASFDRSEAYQELLANLRSLRSELPQLDEANARRQLRQVGRDFEVIARTDFFPGEPQGQTREALDALITLANRRFSPQEPSAAMGNVQRLDRGRYRDRVWATRQHLWVDRVASAWLIRRFVDAKARFLWLQRPEDCPDEALGFDFDRAAFTHIGDRVTFEVLLASFGLDADRGLTGLGRLVHYLDAGGMPVAEAAGFEAVLAGLRECAPNDDALLSAMTPVLDALHRHFSAVDTR